MFTAVVRISGVGRLADFRERLRWLMVRDAAAEDYTEHHADGVLEYRFTPKRGIPFPAFAEASAAFPELTVEAHWERDGARGHARIENGRLVEQNAGGPGASGVAVELGDEGELVFAMACVEDAASCAGYAASAQRQTYFRFEAGALELIDIAQASAELEDVAFGFVEEWLWFDEETGEAAALERARYAGYGYPVRGANVKSTKLPLLRAGSGSYSSLGDTARRAREALKRQWQGLA